MYEFLRWLTGFIMFMVITMGKAAIVISVLIVIAAFWAYVVVGAFNLLLAALSFIISLVAGESD